MQHADELIDGLVAELIAQIRSRACYRCRRTVDNDTMSWTLGDEPASATTVALDRV